MSTRHRNIRKAARAAKRKQGAKVAKKKRKV
jgi:hypothetical protein